MNENGVDMAEIAKMTISTLEKTIETAEKAGYHEVVTAAEDLIDIIKEIIKKEKL